MGVKYNEGFLEKIPFVHFDTDMPHFFTTNNTVNPTYPTNWQEHKTILADESPEESTKRYLKRNRHIFRE